jgi:hypothetical protein
MAVGQAGILPAVAREPTGKMPVGPTGWKHVPRIALRIFDRAIAHSNLTGVVLFMKTLISSGATTLIAASMFAGTVLADPSVNQTFERKQKVEERTIFITGSLIPQRIQLRPIGTTTVSPVRIIDRREIDQTGRRTTPGVLINEPSLRVIGH